VPRFRFPFQPLQVGSHLRRTLIAQVPVFLQRLVDDVFQLGRNLAIESNRRRRIGIQYGVEDQRRGFSMERQRSGCHFVQNCAGRKQIGASIQFPALGLLRRHVSNGAERRAGAGEMIRVQRLRVQRSNLAG
jgi:hypothetical protein